MRVAAGMEFDDDARLAIGAQYGEGKASRKTLRSWVLAIVGSTLEDVVAQWRAEQDAQEVAKP